MKNGMQPPFTLYAPADSLVFLRGFLFLSMIGLFMGV